MDVAAALSCEALAQTVGSVEIARTLLFLGDLGYVQAVSQMAIYRLATVLKILAAAVMVFVAMF